MQSNYSDVSTFGNQITEKERDVSTFGKEKLL